MANDTEPENSEERHKENTGSGSQRFQWWRESAREKVPCRVVAEARSRVWLSWADRLKFWSRKAYKPCPSPLTPQSQLLQEQ